RVIAFSWAVEPLAFRPGVPPQDGLGAVGSVTPVGPVAFLSPAHAVNIVAQLARTASAAPKRLICNRIRFIGIAGIFAVCLAAMTHSNNTGPAQSRPAGTRGSRNHQFSQCFRVIHAAFASLQSRACDRKNWAITCDPSNARVVAPMTTLGRYCLPPGQVCPPLTI